MQGNTRKAALFAGFRGSPKKFRATVITTSGHGNHDFVTKSFPGKKRSNALTERLCAVLCVGGRRLLPCYKNSGPFVHRNAAGNISGGWGGGCRICGTSGRASAQSEHGYTARVGAGHPIASGAPFCDCPLHPLFGRIGRVIHRTILLHRIRWRLRCIRRHTTDTLTGSSTAAAVSIAAGALSVCPSLVSPSSM